MRPARPRSIGRGFTLLETLVTVAVLALALSFGIPAIQNMIYQAKLEGIVRETSVLLQSARLQAIKRSETTVFEIDKVDGVAALFVDSDGSEERNGTEPLLNHLNLPSAVSFGAPPEQAIIEGFNTLADRGWVVFNPDGSVDAEGAFRIADLRGNFLEVRIAPRATAKIEVRKWDGAAWRARDEGGVPWKWK